MSDNTSEKKRRFNPWVPTIILGVITILFSFYAVQSQADMVDAKKENVRLENELRTCTLEAQRQQKEAQAALEEAKKQTEVALGQLEEALKKSGKKK
jgi:hypothetical protein